MNSTQGLLEKIKQAKKSINTASTAEKNKALSLMADYLEAKIIIDEKNEFVSLEQLE